MLSDHMTDWEQVGNFMTVSHFRRDSKQTCEYLYFMLLRLNYSLFTYY